MSLIAIARFRSNLIGLISLCVRVELEKANVYFSKLKLVNKQNPFRRLRHKLLRVLNYLSNSNSIRVVAERVETTKINNVKLVDGLTMSLAVY